MEKINAIFASETQLLQSTVVWKGYTVQEDPFEQTELHTGF